MLFIRPVEAHLTREITGVKSIDSYCILSYEGQQFKTNPHFNGGNRPKWTQTFTFDAKTIGKLKVKLVLKSMSGMDVGLAKGEIDIKKLMLTPGKAVQDFVQLFCEGKSLGKITIQIAMTNPIQKKNNQINQINQKLPSNVRASLPEFINGKNVSPSKLAKLKQQQAKQQSKLQKNHSSSLLFSFAPQPSHIDKESQLNILNPPNKYYSNVQQNVKFETPRPASDIKLEQIKFIKNAGSHDQMKNHHKTHEIPHSQQNILQPQHPGNQQYHFKQKINNLTVPSQPQNILYPQQNFNHQLNYPQKIKSKLDQKESQQQLRQTPVERQQVVALKRTPRKSNMTPRKGKSKSAKKVKFGV